MSFKLSFWAAAALARSSASAAALNSTGALAATAGLLWAATKSPRAPSSSLVVIGLLLQADKTIAMATAAGRVLSLVISFMVGLRYCYC